jgi:hypothetical protein
MIRRIIEHNQLNGVAFSMAEFALVAVAAALLAGGYAREDHVPGVVLALGTGLNSLIIVAFGIVAWRRGERGAPLAQVFSRSGRAELTRQHPRLMADTLIVAIAALVPFALLMATLAEFAWNAIKGA